MNSINLNFCLLNDALAALILEKPEGITSTTMELLGYWWPVFKCGERREGMMLGLRER